MGRVEERLNDGKDRRVEMESVRRQLVDSVGARLESQLWWVKGLEKGR